MPTTPDRPKKTYRSPRLIVHGSLRHLTGMIMPPDPKGGSKGDGAGTPRTRL